MTIFNRSTTGDEVVGRCIDRVKGKTIVITGPTTGSLGAETAITFARGSPEHIFLLGRTASKIEPVLREVKSVDPSIHVEFVAIELDDLASVRAAAATIISKVAKIDYLINNAGIMAVKEYTLTKDGFESQFGINYLSHFLLTNLLNKKVVAAGGGSRIVMVTSDGYQIGPMRFDDYNFSNGKEYDMWSAYGQSKTAEVLFTRRLASRLHSKNIQAYSVHPGVVMTTNLGNHVEQDDFAAIKEIAIRNTGRPFEVGAVKTKQEAISTTLVAAIDGHLADSTGSYLEDCNVKDVYEYAKDPANEERLWVLSEQLTGQKFEV